jgi:5'-nucleotidase
LEIAHLPVEYELLDGHYHYRGRYQDRPRVSGSDVDVCFRGDIALTQVLPTGWADIP